MQMTLYFIQLKKTTSLTSLFFKKKICVSAILMDLSKALDTLNRNLLFAKLKDYDFSAKSLSYIHSHLNKQLQKANVNNNFSIWKEMFLGAPQGSILDPLLFNTYINDIFIVVDEAFLSNYADNTEILFN